MMISPGCRPPGMGPVYGITWGGHRVISSVCAGLGHEQTLSPHTHRHAVWSWVLICRRVHCLESITIPMMMIIKLLPDSGQCVSRLPQTSGSWCQTTTRTCAERQQSLRCWTRMDAVCRSPALHTEDSGGNSLSGWARPPLRMRNLPHVTGSGEHRLRVCAAHRLFWCGERMRTFWLWHRIVRV